MFEFTASGMVDIEPWYHHRYENTLFWKGCGFATRPSYSLVHQRLTELEPYATKFDELAGHLIGVAASKDPNAGAWLRIDGTECETHAAAHHDCGPNDDCPDRALKQLQRLDTRAARRIRHKETLEPTDEEPFDDLDIDERGGRRFRSGDHGWYLRDRSAGRRAYKRDGKVIRSWDGYSLITVIHHYTGAMLSGNIQPANVQEVRRIRAVPQTRPHSAGHRLPSSPIGASTTKRSSSPTRARASAASFPTGDMAITNRSPRPPRIAGTSRASPSANTAAAAPTSSPRSSTAAWPACLTAARCPLHLAATKTSTSTASTTTRASCLCGRPTRPTPSSEKPIPNTSASTTTTVAATASAPTASNSAQSASAPPGNNSASQPPPSSSGSASASAKAGSARRPTRATPPAHLQERPPTDPRDTSETWASGAASRRRSRAGPAPPG
jgi:hypothetical protein